MLGSADSVSLQHFLWILLFLEVLLEKRKKKKRREASLPFLGTFVSLFPVFLLGGAGFNHNRTGNTVNAKYWCSNCQKEFPQSFCDFSLLCLSGYALRTFLLLHGYSKESSPLPASVPSLCILGLSHLQTQQSELWVCPTLRTLLPSKLTGTQSCCWFFNCVFNPFTFKQLIGK
jgi:hypothetical protein